MESGSASESGSVSGSVSGVGVGFGTTGFLRSDQTGDERSRLPNRREEATHETSGRNDLVSLEVFEGGRGFERAFSRSSGSKRRFRHGMFSP